MAMDLTGIENRNEYYTNHYISSIFEENTADTLKKWREDAAANGAKTPWARLKDVASQYYRLRDAASRSRGTAEQEKRIAELADSLLTALGYPEQRKAQWLECEKGSFVPVAMELTKANRLPRLWVMLSHDAPDEQDILTGDVFLPNWHPTETPDGILQADNEAMIGKVFFGQDDPPRWVLLIGLNQIALIDRNKWSEKRLLVFDLDDIFGRHEDSTLQAMAVLLHRDSLCPAEGNSLLDVLDENSHKHASGVSKDLKYALRQCIEMLGNEVVYDMTERQHVGVFGKELADDLTLQCLRYMYRILFMLFIEAKPELGYAPMKADTYAMGYSFESLREITDAARGNSEINADGNYLKESMNLLFRMVYDGFPTDDENKEKAHGESLSGVFAIDPLKAHIFDPDKTALIENAHIRNDVLLEIIDLMSLTRARKGQRRGRISYANLGVNQLGAVYEALLSYRGFFAEEDLYEVKRKGDEVDVLDVGYFIPARELEQYDEDERVRNEDGTLRVHAKGKFIYRLAGREREKSASYYTPEVLTKCLVKYALKELLTDKTADEILSLTVCEPAMGSAAFLNEAVSQIAEAYLTRKEKELGQTVPSEERVQELQKVKMFIADRNVYGIDLNPTAVELAEVSLWLNTIYQGGYVPWFRTQIVNGNSLIGARRQCYTLAQTQGKNLWYNSAPERIEPGQKRKFARQVYHFLLGDTGMCAYTDKVIKAMEPDKLAFIKAWNKAFTKELTDAEQDDLLRLCDAIDKLWDAHAQMRDEIKEKCTDPLTVWGQPEDSAHKPTTIRDKDRMYDELYLSKGGNNASPYARLKAVMDYWCALWFWPIDKAEELPTRQEYLWDMNMLLGVDVVDTRARRGQLSMFDDLELDPYAQELIARYGKFGAVNLDNLRRDFPRLRIANEVAEQQHFFHWELEFADVFAERGGFDLIIGNPPWVKMEWNEQAVMSDRQPMFAVKNFTATQTAHVRGETLKEDGMRALYFSEYEGMSGTQAFLNAVQNYPDLKGQQTNLFKCFLPQAWQFGGKAGVSAFVHPDGVYDDPKGGALRAKLYQRLCLHMQYENELNLFVGTNDHGRLRFSLNIYQNGQKGFSFDTINNLFYPTTLDECYDDSITGVVPGIKDENGNWNVHGHPDRVIHVGQKELKLFAKLFDGSDQWRMARLPVLHARQLVEVLERFAAQKNTLGELKDSVFTTEMWHETNTQKDGTIRRDVHFPESVIDMICSGPYIGVANPLFKTSRRICIQNSDYDSLDLSNLPEDYLQRCNYRPACNLDEYKNRAPALAEQDKFFHHYRTVWRSMLNQSGERTMIPAIIPPFTGHVDLVYEFFGRGQINTVVASTFASLPFDFYIKATGKAHARYDVISCMPCLINAPQINKIMCRGLLLNCLTAYYTELWKNEWQPTFPQDGWAKSDPRLRPSRFTALTPDWTWDTPLRTDYERRQALVELDVLTAMALGMTLDQLKTIYRIQFPVLRQYEADTWYDANGRIVFTTNRSLTGVGFDRKEWEQSVKGAPAGKIFTRTIIDDTRPGGPVERTMAYVAPFDKCDREQDYETAWAYFSQ